MPCQERDRIILAFALAVNEKNSVSSNLETLADEAERKLMQLCYETSSGHCRALQDRLIVHCQEHGC